MTKMRGTASFKALLAVSCAALVNLPAYAQAEPSAEADPPTDSPNNAQPNATSAVESPPSNTDIVVTAQRRTERLQDVPLSAVVLGGAKLQETGTLSLEQLTQNVPSLTITKGGAGNRLFIRGIGSGDNNPLFEQSVATFVDDIYRGRSRSVQGTFLDVARVEVLKGPQSVFFGNNSIAGVLNVVTEDPGNELDGFARVLYNFDYDRWTTEAAVGGPITDTLGIRVAGIATKGEGWLVDNGLGGVRVPKEDNYAGRVTLSWRPNERLKVNLKAQFESGDQTGFIANEIAFCPPVAPFPGAASGNCAFAISKGYDVELNRVRQTTPGHGTNLDSQTYVARLSYDTDWFTLSSITGYMDVDYEARLDADHNPETRIHFTFPEQFSQFSQEFRMQSVGSGMLQYSFGAYYQADDLHAPIYYNYAVVSPFLTGPFAPLGTYGPFGQTDDARQKTKSHALYGSLTFKPVESLELTVGGRQSWVDKDIVLDQYFGFASTPFGIVTPYPTQELRTLGNAFGTALRFGSTALRTDHRTDSHFSPSATLRWKVARDISLYARYVQGFKAGGFNSTERVGADFNYEPENVDAFELGLRAQFLNRRLTTNLTLFRNEFEGLQASVSNITGAAGAVIISVQNVGGSVAQGAEFETRFQATPELSFGLDFTLLDSHYTDYPNATGTPLDALQGRPVIDLTGVTTPYAPDYSGRFEVNYERDIGTDLYIRLNGNAFLSGAYNFSFNNDRFLNQDDFVRLGAVFAIGSHNRGLELSLIAQNITDQGVRVGGTNLPQSPGSYLIALDEPRNISAQLRYSF